MINLPCDFSFSNILMGTSVLSLSCRYSISAVQKSPYNVLVDVIIINS